MGYRGILLLLNATSYFSRTSLLTRFANLKGTGFIAFLYLIHMFCNSMRRKPWGLWS